MDSIHPVRSDIEAINQATKLLRICNITSPDDVTFTQSVLSKQSSVSKMDTITISDAGQISNQDTIPCSRCCGSGVETNVDKKYVEQEPFKSITDCYNFLVENLKKVIILNPTMQSQDWESEGSLFPGFILLEKDKAGIVNLQNSIPRNLFEEFIKEQHKIEDTDINIDYNENSCSQLFESQSTMKKYNSKFKKTKGKSQPKKEIRYRNKSPNKYNCLPEVSKHNGCSETEDDINENHNTNNRLIDGMLETINVQNYSLRVPVTGLMEEAEIKNNLDDELKVPIEKLNYCPVCEEDFSNYVCKQINRHNCAGFKCVKAHIGRHLYWDEERAMIFVDRSTHGEGKTMRDTLKKHYRIRRKKIVYNHDFGPDETPASNSGKKDSPTNKSIMEWISGATDIKDEMVENFQENVPLASVSGAVGTADQLLSQNSHKDVNIFQSFNQGEILNQNIQLNDNNPRAHITGTTEEKPSDTIIINKSCKDQMNEQILLHEILNQTFSKFDDIPYNGDFFQRSDFVFKCSICSLGYLRASELTLHREFHPDQKTEYDKTRMILLPQKNKYVLKKMDKCCDLCGQVFKGRGNQNFKDHILLHENPNAFQCDICHANLSTSTGLKYHKLKHFKEKNRTALERAGYLDDKSSYICEICGKSFGQNYKLKLHERQVHRGETIVFPCNFCDKTYKSKEAMYLHRRKMHPQTMKAACQFCGATFLTERKLKRHLLNSHSDGKNEIKSKSIPCTVCGMLLAKGSLKGHMMAHRGERPFVCNICGKSFSIKGNLTSHEKLHLNAAPFKCDFCGKTFKRKDYMENHRRIHTDERPFACGVCGQRFKQKGDMIRHERKHTVVEKTQLEDTFS